MFCQKIIPVVPNEVFVEFRQNPIVVGWISLQIKSRYQLRSIWLSVEEDMTFGRIDQTAYVYTQSNQREKSFSYPIEMIVLKK